MLQRYFDLSHASDIDAFRAQMLDFAHEMGFGLITATLVIEGMGPRGPAQIRSVGNTPAAFEAASTDVGNSRRDPVLKRYRQLSVPFVYDVNTYADEGAGDLWEEQAPFGYRTGVCVALHLQGNRHFLLGVDREERLPANEILLTRMMADLQLMAVHAQSAAQRLLAGPEPSAVAVRLSPRELEVLRWTMLGKSTSVAAELMQVTTHAVDFHLRNIARKLGTSTKTQAVLKAIGLGLLQPPP